MSRRGKKLLLVALGVVLPGLLLAALELGLAAFGVAEEALYDDPFVGFAPGSDLFAERRLPDGREVYRTRPEKLAFFNEQSFAADKPADGYRVFALGGSTTAGRPYDDRVAFARWLELYLEDAEPSRSWEVVNAGAISYASYRVALLMKELVRYEPDLFVVYTGHNEFLEERSYPDVVQQPAAVERLRMWLSGFRFAALARRALRGGGEAVARGQAAEGGGADAPRTLAPEVAAKLDSWGGLEAYERDDELAAAVVAHFESNLRRMVRIARGHGAGVVFVEPVSNLADFSPFKSQHGAGIDAAAAARHAELVARGRAALDAGDATAAVATLEAAVELDPRHAEGWFRLGRARLAAGAGDGAYAAFLRAKDEDVAPLRALEPIVEAVARVAAEEEVPLVPLRRELEDEHRRRFGHRGLGDAYLLDHVHPDVPVHGRIAEAVLAILAADGVVDPRAAAGEASRQAIYRRELAGFDREYYARRDLNLAKVLGWAGKLEEAETPLRRAAEVIPEEPEVWLDLGIVEQRTGRHAASLASLDRAAALAPRWELVHFNRGVALARLGRDAEAVAALRRALELRPVYPEAQRNLAVLLRERGDLDAALAALDAAEAAGTDGADPALRHDRALVYRAQGRYAEAEEILRTLTAASPGDPVLRTDLAVTLARQGRLEAAAAELGRALAAGPAHAEAWYNLGVVRARGAGREAAVPGDAEAAYRRTLELAPDHPEAHNALGVLLAGRGETGAALEHLRAAAEAAPEWAEARFNLGVALDGAGRPAEALAAVERAVELDPDNARFHFALGSLYAARGEAARALDHLERARAGGQPVPEPLLADLRRRAG
jgi:tetratricopeptide (TPR) repeat protein